MSCMPFEQKCPFEHLVDGMYVLLSAILNWTSFMLFMFLKRPFSIGNCVHLDIIFMSCMFFGRPFTIGHCVDVRYALWTAILDIVLMPCMLYGGLFSI